MHWTRWWVTVMSWALGLVLAYAVVQLPANPGLWQAVRDGLGDSGVSSPVTAVLLNFRGYDTLLETGVLLLALISAWAIGPAHSESHWLPPSAVLLAMIRLFVPLMVVIGAYLLWQGTHAPGGAFQAGAMFGAAGVLLLIADTRIAWLPAGWPLRLLLALGFTNFLAVGLAMLALSGRFLEYLPTYAGDLIKWVEVAATVSIGVTLIVLFLGGQPEHPIGRDPGAGEEP